MWQLFFFKYNLCTYVHEHLFVKLFFGECHRTFGDMLTLGQVMAWCHQATSHLSQCWPRFILLYAVIRPQWVNWSIFKDISVINLPVAETGIFQTNLDNTMAVDDLLMQGPRSSATITLTMQDKPVLVFNREGFQLPAHSSIEKWNKYIFQVLWEKINMTLLRRLIFLALSEGNWRMKIAGFSKV